ncbi:glycosyltransferase family 10 domain-containing protein [Foetidibacter luteolus]|uniref:glycosyltransferase family 10 domain-containing protein n=1 Tax=Foetidibacter luteolus TaxID=2608880 RepID=UPI00129A1383|nr:glycosyltransferase family 10 [Foetidibacter luteolus]
MHLKINFTDFWPGFNKYDNFFLTLLSRKYSLEVSDDPDVVFFSVFGQEYKKYKCVRIFFTGEFYEPKLFNANLSISFSRVADERNYRFPLAAFYFDLRELLNKPSYENIFPQKKKFCCFVVSNGSCKTRNNFFKQLSKYKKVDSGGRYLNNIGGPVTDKVAFLSQYKFIIAFENTSYPGYLTEKIVEPMRVGTIPIYWGDPLIGEDFNASSFINIHNYKSTKDAIEKVIELDNNDEEYKMMLAQPWFAGNVINENFLWENLLDKLTEVIEKGRYNSLSEVYDETVFQKFLDKINRRIRGERPFG